jgi:GAF domain-containing protein
VSEEAIRAAVAGAVVGAEADYRELLDAVAQAARAIFRARAASIFLIDDATGELVFAAVAGEGQSALVGRRFPAGTGIAGWVAAARQPLVLDDVSQDPRFSREAAETTGYVPRAILAVPLLHRDDALGVLQVLDRAAGPFGLKDMELLGLFARQAAVALDLLGRARRAEALLRGGPDELRAVVRVAGTLEAQGPAGRESGLRLLAALADLMERPR